MRMRHYKTVFLVIIISFISVSCGKKGPLYLSVEDNKKLDPVENKTQDEAVKVEKNTVKKAPKPLTDIKD